MHQDLESKIGCNCPYCGVGMGRKEYRPTRDHMTPRSRGGTLEAGNKVIVCQPCNLAKGDLTIHEFYRALKSRNDPRVTHVQRFILGIDVYFAGRLRIPGVSREVRRSYPLVKFILAKHKDFSVATLVPKLESEHALAPSFGM